MYGKVARCLLSFIFLVPPYCYAGQEIQPQLYFQSPQNFVGSVGCKFQASSSSPHTFTIPPDLMSRASKKARLIELLKESLTAEATSVDGTRKPSSVDVRLEKQIQKLMKELK